MKLYIVADMEGIAGVVSAEEISTAPTWEQEQARRQFTNEVAVVCQGALDAGAEEIYVNDFHGNGRNLMMDKLPSQVMLVRGGFRPTAGFDLLDQSFGGLVLLGAHTRSGSLTGVIPHTYSPKLQFEIFGQPVGEFDLLALIAGEKKVPTILISGDDKTIEQASTNLPSTIGVITKWAIGTRGAMCLHPGQVLTLLKEEIRRAVKNAATFEPPAINPPIQLLIRPLDSSLIENLSWIPKLKLLPNGTFEFMGESMLEIANIVYGVTLLASAPIG